MKYLEKIYNKAKEDGHFTKFETFEDFKNYFRDETSYLKLHSFLLSKNYKIPEINEFVLKITGGHLVFNKDQKGIFNQPPSAVGEIEYQEGHFRSLPDIIKIGIFSIPGLEKETPVFLPFSDKGGISITFENHENKEKASQILQVLAYRLLLSLPSRQSKFYIIDHEKNGGSFINLLGLDDKILEQEIWDDTWEITNGISKIKDEVPRILSKNLQSKYSNLAEYNQKIEHSNQPFQFILIANFPKAFNQEATEKLLNLLKNGNKAGIFVLMSIDKSVNPEYNVSIDEFFKINPIIDLDNRKILNTGNDEVYNHKFFIKEFDTQLPSNIQEIKTRLNQEAQKQRQVKIDLNKSGLSEWTESAAKGIKIPIGITESNEQIDFIFGLNTDSYHALIGGATGSGKSVLLHNIIINAAQLYSPDELQFILLDYKEGTEFIVYEKLPQVKILSVECEREYGLSVLEFLSNSITERGSLFKKYGAGNLEEYIKASGDQLPRYLVIIDEFQVLLSGQGSLSSKASQMIEDVTRRGRSFGVNLILATQSLADVDISTSTLGQLGLRIGMKMGEADSNRILSVNNSIPVGFERPGLAVYNRQGGDVKGNIIFQSAFISKTEIEKKVTELSLKNQDYKKFGQFINNGHPTVLFEDNKEISTQHSQPNNNFCDVFLGKPAYLEEDHYKIRLRKQGESNIYVEGDVPQDIISVFYYSFFQLIQKSSPDSLFYIFDLFDIDSGDQGKLEELKNLSNNLKIYNKEKPLENRLSEIKDELSQRIEEESGKHRICLGIINGQRIRGFKKDGYSDSQLSTMLQEIIKDGPDYGIHTILHFQNSGQLSESFDNTPKFIKYFENKILLKGSNTSKYVDDYSVNDVKKPNTAYILQPNSRYKADLINLYKKRNDE